MQKIFITALLLMAAIAVSAQNADSIKKQKQIKYYQQKLRLSNDQAGQVSTVHEQYKSALKAITDNPNLSETEKRKAAEQLMAEKNRKLSGLLSPEQLDAVVPISERKAVNQKRKKAQIVTRKDSTKLGESIRQSLVIPKDKARQVMFVQLSYKEHSRQLLADSSLSEAVKRTRLNQLIRERNQKLNQLLTPGQVSKIVPQSEQKL